jgi:hypothetical protein
MVAGLLALTGCGRTDSGSPRLRVRNGGTTPIRALTVMFPEDRIAFGDVAVGASSPYRQVPHGVYRYAAYSLEIDGSLVTQPVIDWVGEQPMPGTAFTYTLEVNALGSPLEFVRLVSVTPDE